MIDHGNQTVPPLHHDISGVWHANQLGSGHLVHFEISRENVIRCIWIDRLPNPFAEDDAKFDLDPLTDYIM